MLSLGSVKPRKKRKMMKNSVAASEEEEAVDKEVVDEEEEVEIEIRATTWSLKTQKVSISATTSAKSTT